MGKPTQVQEQPAQYRVSYRYINPSGAGPFRGKSIEGRKYEKGETIRAMFGAAMTVSCGKVRAK